MIGYIVESIHNNNYIILDKYSVGNRDYLILDTNHKTGQCNGCDFNVISLKEQLVLYKKHFTEYIKLPKHLNDIIDQKI